MVALERAEAAQTIVSIGFFLAICCFSSSVVHPMMPL